MAALQRAIALAQVDGVALAVAEHLDLDVARLGQVLLDVDGIVAERGLGLRARGRQREAQIGRRVRDLHAAPAAAGGRLDQHGEAHVLGDLHRLGLARHGAVGARHDRNAEALGGLLGLDLVAHDADVLGRRADEGDLVLFQDLGEAGVLREEAVAGMHGVGAGDLAGGEQARNVEVAFGGGRRADADAFVGEPHVHGIGVGRRMHRDGGDAELLARALDAQCDLSPVGDQDLVEHSLLGSGRSAIGSQGGEDASTACCLLPMPHSLFDDDQRLAELDRLAVLEQDCGDLARLWRGDLVHGLHGFDDEQRVALRDAGADFDECGRAGLGRAVGRCRPSATSRRRGAWQDRRRRLAAARRRPERAAAADAATAACTVTCARRAPSARSSRSRSRSARSRSATRPARGSTSARRRLFRPAP